MDEKMTVEKANEQLEIIVEKLDKGNMPLEETVECYEEACKLIEYCYKQLDDYNLRITNASERIEAVKKSGDPFEE